MINVSKKGTITMKGTGDQIFSDLVYATEAFCKAMAPKKHVSETDILLAVVLATAERTSADIDIKHMRKKLKKMEERDVQ